MLAKGSPHLQLVLGKISTHLEELICHDPSEPISHTEANLLWLSIATSLQQILLLQAKFLHSALEGKLYSLGGSIIL